VNVKGPKGNPAAISSPPTRDRDRSRSEISETDRASPTTIQAALLENAADLPPRFLTEVAPNLRIEVYEVNVRYARRLDLGIDPFLRCVCNQLAAPEGRPLTYVWPESGTSLRVIEDTPDVMNGRTLAFHTLQEMPANHGGACERQMARGRRGAGPPGVHGEERSRSHVGSP